VQEKVLVTISQDEIPPINVAQRAGLHFDDVAGPDGGKHALTVHAKSHKSPVAQRFYSQCIALDQIPQT